MRINDDIYAECRKRNDTNIAEQRGRQQIPTLEKKHKNAINVETTTFIEN